MTALDPTAVVERLRPFDAERAPSTATHLALIDAGPVVAVPGPQGESRDSVC